MISYRVIHIVDVLNELSKMHSSSLPLSLSLDSHVLFCCKWNNLFSDDKDRVGGGGPHPLENHKNMGFLNNTGLDPHKNHKIGHHRHASKRPFQWGLLAAR